ncbi:hypothetical protein KFE25_005666 [Diacronema lutheri]|uniref:Uncharacterized protein n=1 Tax=Diacronema lutheri TaxID=2081491 RepID=A0A8J5XKP5_DIALT|nr:hypothetical protein KFE25_005666 [Diacronema lutheri]
MGLIISRGEANRLLVRGWAALVRAAAAPPGERWWGSSGPFTRNSQRRRARRRAVEVLLAWRERAARAWRDELRAGRAARARRARALRRLLDRARAKRQMRALGRAAWPAAARRAALRHWRAGAASALRKPTPRSAERAALARWRRSLAIRAAATAAVAARAACARWRRVARGGAARARAADGAMRAHAERLAAARLGGLRRELPRASAVAAPERAPVDAFASAATARTRRRCRAALRAWRARQPAGARVATLRARARARAGCAAVWRLALRARDARVDDARRHAAACARVALGFARLCRRAAARSHAAPKRPSAALALRAPAPLASSWRRWWRRCREARTDVTPAAGAGPRPGRHPLQREAARRSGGFARAGTRRAAHASTLGSGAAVVGVRRRLMTFV